MYLEVAIHVGGMRNSAFREDQGEENTFFAVLGISVPQGSFVVPLLKWGWFLHGQF